MEVGKHSIGDGWGARSAVRRPWLGEKTQARPGSMREMRPSRSELAQVAGRHAVDAERILLARWRGLRTLSWMAAGFGTVQGPCKGALDGKKGCGALCVDFVHCGQRAV